MLGYYSCRSIYQEKLVLVVVYYYAQYYLSFVVKGH